MNNLGKVTEDLPNSKISRTTPEAQGDSVWSPPHGTLGELAESARARSSSIAGLPPAAAIAAAREGVPSLKRALRKEHVAIIAEIKRSSPSRGWINPGLDSAIRAGEYEKGGAAAFSVLTEPDHFGGRDEDIVKVRAASALPILKKDFHVTSVQIAHAAHLGASAALVIVRAIEPQRLGELAAAAADVGLELLFEVRDERELDRALEAGASMIGVNNRDLETLRIDPSTSARIMPRIPASCVAIAESGFTSRADVESAARAGADAVLIGSSLSSSSDPVSALERLTRVPRLEGARS